MPLPIALQLTETAARATTSGGSPGADLTWLATVVVVFVVTITAIAFGFKKALGGALRSRASKRDLRVLDVLPLGGKRQLAVVRCYDRTFALGLAEKSVDLVAELDTDAIECDRGAAESGERAEAFIARLEAAKARLLGIREVVPPAASTPPSAATQSAATQSAATQSAATPSAATPPEHATPRNDAPSPKPPTATQEFVA